MNFELEKSSQIDFSAIIGAGTRIWHNTQVCAEVRIGDNCIVGRNVYIGPGVQIGNNCKIQNNALIYEPARIADGVFIGPAVTLTNDQYPRAVNPDLTLKSKSDWNRVGVSIGTGASIGAGAICIAPVEVGAWALVAAGAVVIEDVPKYALVAGSPAKQKGWVGKTGHKLDERDGNFVCPVTGTKYYLSDGTLEEGS